MLWPEDHIRWCVCPPCCALRPSGFLSGSAASRPTAAHLLKPSQRPVRLLQQLGRLLPVAQRVLDLVLQLGDERPAFGGLLAQKVELAVLCGGRTPAPAAGTTADSNAVGMLLARSRAQEGALFVPAALRKRHLVTATSLPTNTGFAQNRARIARSVISEASPLALAGPERGDSGSLRRCKVLERRLASTKLKPPDLLPSGGSDHCSCTASRPWSLAGRRTCTEGRSAPCTHPPPGTHNQQDERDGQGRWCPLSSRSCQQLRWAPLLAPACLVF